MSAIVLGMQKGCCRSMPGAQCTIKFQQCSMLNHLRQSRPDNVLYTQSKPSHNDSYVTMQHTQPPAYLVLRLCCPCLAQQQGPGQE